MLKCAFLFLSLTTVAYASYQATCCVPDQFEGVIGDVQGFVKTGKAPPGMSVGAVKLSFDFTNKKVAEYINQTTQGILFQQKLISDYVKNVQYAIDEKAKTCNATSPPPPLQRCLPNGAKLLGSFYFGSGSNILKAQSFAVNDTTQHVGSIVSLTMDCVPIVEVASGFTPAGVDYMTIMAWTDTTIGIKDPSVFTPPSYCQQVDVVESKSKAFVGSFLHSKKPGFN